MFGPDRVKSFLCQSYGFMNVSICKKSELLRRNISRENGSEAIGNNLGDDLIEIVAQRYGFLIVERGWGVTLWDEGNKCSVGGMI